MCLRRLMQYQVSRNCERAAWIDRHYIEREQLADFTDKDIPSKFIARAAPYRRISIGKNLLPILLPYVVRAKFR